MGSCNLYNMRVFIIVALLGCALATRVTLDSKSKTVLKSEHSLLSLGDGEDFAVTDAIAFVKKYGGIQKIIDEVKKLKTEMEEKMKAAEDAKALFEKFSGYKKKFEEYMKKLDAIKAKAKKMTNAFKGIFGKK